MIQNSQDYYCTLSNCKNFVDVSRQIFSTWKNVPKPLLVEKKKKKPDAQIPDPDVSPVSSV